MAGRRKTSSIYSCRTSRSRSVMLAGLIGRSGRSRTLRITIVTALRNNTLKHLFYELMTCGCLFFDLPVDKHPSPAIGACSKYLCTASSCHYIRAAISYPFATVVFHFSRTRAADCIDDTNIVTISHFPLLAHPHTRFQPLQLTSLSYPNY